MTPLICPQCGGTVNRATLTCEFCGTQFKVEHDERTMEFKIVRVDTDTVPVIAKAFIPRHIVNNSEPEELAEMATNRLAHSLANGIKEYMDLRLTEDFATDALIVSGVVRLIRPKDNTSLWELMR